MVLHAGINEDINKADRRFIRTFISNGRDTATRIISVVRHHILLDMEAEQHAHRHPTSNLDFGMPVISSKFLEELEK